ncbi:MAG: hypothetical protein AABZ76_23250 [Pseudomonadota bacterium]|jgi:hypothetical protein|uniref:hypothetical protein n=1 Tax=Sphingobium yanoikuyae TaxID=13690 RepID=UPI00137809CB|nr:hypothetical protein [Sphingobium yanoikuyae]NBB40541.1 hypothetical protein [Sphingobium yanoikuyae]
MASLASAPSGLANRWRNAIGAHPDRCYWIVAVLLYGTVAIYAAHGHFLYQTSRDLWQHLAAVDALIENPWNPKNPFLPGQEGSRHFHPYWVGMAMLARLMGWNGWQAIAAGGFVTATLLVVGIRAFALSFFRDRWAPMALMMAMALGWSFPISHTGFHSIETLIEGLAYPAVLLIALSLLLWALVIQALARPAAALIVTPLTALMFATHQLGAGIGFMVAGAFILLWPHSCWRNRLAVILAMMVGLALAALWSYHNPFVAMVKTGNATWTGGINFYAPTRLFLILFPSSLGLIGLWQPEYRRRAWPIMASIAGFGLLFATGAYGVLVATRFAPPLVLMLQIGLAGLILMLARRWSAMSDAKQLGWFTFASLCIAWHLMVTISYLMIETGDNAKRGNAYAQAQRLTADIPDQQPVAAWDVVAWPVVATGQRVMSVPWPEPMITDLAVRQKDLEALFRPELTRSQRLAITRKWGVKTLIVDSDGPLRREMPKNLLVTLRRQSVRMRTAGPLFRFDLE